MASDENRPTKRRKINCRDTITVLVGKNEEKFTIHEDAITRHSHFFQAACSGRFKEAEEKIVRLLEMRSDVFEAYIQWVYSGVVVIMEDEETLIAEDKACNIVMSLGTLYAAGDMLGDTRLRNACIDRIIASCEKYGVIPGPKTVTNSYIATPESSTLRKLSTDYYLAASIPTAFKKNNEEYPRSFLVDLVHGRMANHNERTSRPSSADRCKYHEHNGDVPKCSE